MADGMAEVEKGARSRSLLFVFFDYPGFDGHVTSDQLGGNILILRVESF